MSDWLAYLFGRLFVFFFNLCGRMDYDMATEVLGSMYHTLEREKKIYKTQENYRKALQEPIAFCDKCQEWHE